MMRSIIAKILYAAVLLVGLTCVSGGTGAQQTVIFVNPGDPLREIVSQAPAGATIIVRAGEYRDSLTVTQPGIRLIGAGASEDGTVLSNEGVGADNGITVLAGADDFELTGFLVRGFDENGIVLLRVQNYRVTNNVFEKNGEYAVFPILSTGGVISNNVATGHTDAALYVGQSSGAVVSHNTSFGNIIGIEVENSSDCIVSENEVFDNVTGILVVELPGLQVRETTNITVMKNFVHNNNNPGDNRAGGLVEVVPTGGGILIVGADSVSIADNIILENNSFGIGIARLPPIIDVRDPLISHIPDNSRTVGNLSLKNGREPDAERIGILIQDFPRQANLFWDGTGSGHCFEGNIVTDDEGGTSFPPPQDLPACSNN